MKVLALVYPGMTLLDLVGPMQAWSFLPGYEVQYAWHRSGAVPTDCGRFLLDTQDQPVPARVWELYTLAQEPTGGVSTLLEWDANIPDFPELVAELRKA